MSISATLPVADKDAVLAALATIREKLPFLTDLTPEQRRTIPKMGDKTRAFVAKALEIARQNPGILPRNFDIPEFERDATLFEAIQPILQNLVQLTELVDDTAVNAGADAYAAALTVYQSAKTAGRGEGLDGLVDEMGRRFAKKSRPAPAPAA